MAATSHGGGGASLWATSVNMVVCTAGAGVLSFPYAARRGGAAALAVSTVGFAAIAAYCCLILAEAAYAHRATLRARTFDEVVWRVLGRRHYAAVCAQTIVGLTGALTGFFCVAGDIGQPVAAALCGGDARCAPLARREAVILLFAVFVALPLAGCARVHALRGTSALAVAAVAAVGLLVVARAAAGPAISATPPPPASAPVAGGGGGALDDCIGVALSVPIVLYALGCHVQFVNIFLDGSDATQRHADRAVLGSYAVVIALYLSTGLAGFALFGESTPGNVLAGFGLGDGAADAVKLLMALHLALVIPVDAIPTRRAFALAARVFGEGRRRSRELAAAREEAASSSGDVKSHGGGGLLIADATTYDEFEALQQLGRADEEAEKALPHVCGSPCSRPIAAQTIVFVMGAATAACAFPSVTVVFGLLGATLGVTCMISYPALFLLARADALDAEAAVARGDSDAGALLVNGDGVDGGGGGGAGAGASGGGAAASNAPPLNFWSPRSPFWLRVHGYAMLVLSAVLIVLGTSAYVYETWLS
jgi:amino acid permease